MFDIFGKAKQLQVEKARLEAFLSSVPGEYCGWASDETCVYSKGFCDALGLSAVEGMSDILAMILYEDGAALEGLFERLVQTGVAFTINVKSRDDKKTLKISGTRGMDVSGTDHFHVLWLEDITAFKSASDILTEEQELLRGDVERLQDSLDALPFPVWIRDAAQKITWSNVAYAKMIDAKLSDIIAQQKEIISADRKKKPGEKDMVFGADLAGQAYEGGAVKSVQAHQVFAGKRLFLKISEVPVRDKKITVGMAENLTEHEQQLDEVRNHQAAHLSLLEHLRSAIGIYDADHCLTFYNSSFAQLWGLEDGWLNTKPKLGDLMEKLRETRRLPEQADFRSYKKGWLDMFTALIDPHEDMLYLPDGSAVRMFVIPHKVGGLMMVFEDVTSRLELESSYNTLVAVQEETLDNLAEGVAVYGGDGRLKLWNPRFADLWSLSPEGLEGEPHVTRVVSKMESFFPEDQWDGIRGQQIEIALDRSVNSGTLKHMHDRYYDYATVPLPDGGVLVTYDDVTDTVRIENALRDKNEALETAERLKLDFLANVSYQLRTPLNAIMGFNEMLSQEFFGALNDKQKEYTSDIQGASEKLLNLVNDILDLSTIEAGQMDLSIEQVKVKSMMEAIVDLVQDWARKEHIEVVLKCPVNIGAADIDSSRIKQAVVNLVRNAITYTQEGGEIQISAARRGDDIEFSVSDNGAGISEENQARILQPFERVEQDGGADRGAGLGLALVRNIAELHGGSFDLSSEEGRGTTVVLKVPRFRDSV